MRGTRTFEESTTTGAHTSAPSGLRTVQRVHIAPTGYERDRILLPATRYDADLVYLLVDVGVSAAPTYHGEVVDELEAAGVDVRTEAVPSLRSVPERLAFH